jgi:hypothetical protein
VRNQQIAAVLAWELRRRPSVAMSLRTALALSGLDACRTLTLLNVMALCLPIQPVRWGWAVVDVTPAWPMPRNAAQRGAVLAWTLAQHPLTVLQAAALTGLARNSAYVALVRVAEVVPIWDDNSQWRTKSRQGVLWRGT